MEDKRGLGRPELYTREKAEEVCLHIIEGRSIRYITRLDDMPAMSTIFLWLTKHAEFQELYREAKAFQAEIMADEILEIADNDAPDADVNRDRLRVDSRKWTAVKLLPLKYGERISQELSGPNGKPIQTEQVSAVDRLRDVLDRNKPAEADAEPC